MHQSEKLAIFVDDARRGGITVLPPSLNHSEAEYTVEQTDDGYAVRYALAGIRNVGERAMEAIVEEREAAGRFESLKDLFERLPKGSMNSRQLEALISAGALDEFEPNRAKLMANADMLLAVADAAERERSSGQAGLFGGEDAAVDDDLRLKDAEDWSLSEARAREKETMGFSFKQHATAAYREIASAQGARSHASLMSGGVPGGGRMGAVMAVQVEGASKGTTKRGKPFIRADFSDASGQFSAACFEEGLVEKFLEWARNGTCVKLDVELDSPSPDEPPRITVRGAVPLDAVRGSMAMLLTLEVESVEAVTQLALALGEGGQGGDEAVATLLTGDPTPPVVRLGRTFSIDGELAERLASVPGLAKVQLTARRGKANLRLVA
jgi:DNA polymerase-3 subunit alpha